MLWAWIGFRFVPTRSCQLYEKERSVKSLLTAVSVLSLVLPATRSLAADAPQPEEGFVSLFDGKTLDGWKVGENANLFRVHKGIIVMECPPTVHGPAHLFYEGEVGQHDFKNFVFKVDVMTFPGANSASSSTRSIRRAAGPTSGWKPRSTTVTSTGGGPAAFGGSRTSRGARKRRRRTTRKPSRFFGSRR